MGLISRIFGKNKKGSNITKPYVSTTGYGSWFTKDLSKSQSDVIQSAINVIALHASKMRFKHNWSGKKEKDKSYLETLLNTQPNIYTASQPFIYKFVSALFYYDNSYIYPRKDIMNVKEPYKEFWPLDPSTTQLLEGDNNTLWIKFFFNLGQQSTQPYTEMIHLRNYFTDDDIIGGLKYPEMSLENITNYDLSRKSIANATAMSSRIIGKLLLADSLNEEDRLAAITKFNNFLATTESQSAVYPEDMNATLEAIDLKPKSAAGAQLKSLKNDVLEHIPLCLKILDGTYSEQEYNNFYEIILEPVAVQVGQVFTNTIFSDREKEAENEIIMTTNLLKHASWKTKIAVANFAKDIGAMRLGAIREMLGEPWGADGDDYMKYVNYDVKSKDDKDKTKDDDTQSGQNGDDKNKGEEE